jgi:hypothetical protein
MKRAKSILYGATALTIIAASVTGMMMEDSSTANASMQYEVDEDRDGRTDRMLYLEQSDSLA